MAQKSIGNQSRYFAKNINERDKNRILPEKKSASQAEKKANFLR